MSVEDNIRLSKILIELNITIDVVTGFLKKKKNIEIPKNPNQKVSKYIGRLLFKEFYGEYKTQKDSIISPSDLKLEFDSDLYNYKISVINCLSKQLSASETKIIKNKRNINSIKRFLSRRSNEVKTQLNSCNINFKPEPRKKKSKKKKSKKKTLKQTKTEPIKIIYTPMGNKR